MSEAERALSGSRLMAGFRDWFADHLGVDEERKQILYEDLSSAANLLDVTYWLQILFAAGIATLGLVLNSPAVIIGAMLISPLMGPILSGGLALATGDVLLGIRAIINLFLSCGAAIVFAVLLVALLPFKEMTGEIASRMQPTTLDLVVALFSGAIGSIATCKKVRGVVTSIPGVAIAVALMPPLCVAGYGIGFAFSASASEGMRIAGGGALLFLTNLVAITFTAMIVFLLLHIDTGSVRKRIEIWRGEDVESRAFRNAMERLHISGIIRRIGSFPSRLLLIGVPILVILIPLAQSFTRLKLEIGRQQEENRIRRAATDMWRQGFEKINSQQRSFIDNLSVSEQDGKITLQLRVFTSKPVTTAERNEYIHMVAARLDKPQDGIALQLIEIPTTSDELVSKSRVEKSADVPSFTEIQASFLQGVASALANLKLPPPAAMIDYRVTIDSSAAVQIDISYLSSRDIQQDAAILIGDEVRSRLNYPTAQVKLSRVQDSFGPITFAHNRANVNVADTSQIDRAGQTLLQHPELSVEIIPGAESREREGIAGERGVAIKDYLISRWEVSDARVAIQSISGATREATLKFKATR